MFTVVMPSTTSWLLLCFLLLIFYKYLTPSGSLKINNDNVNPFVVSSSKLQKLKIVNRYSSIKKGLLW